MSSENEDGNERPAAFWTWFRRGRRAHSAYSWYGRLDWLLSLFKTKAELALFAGSTAVIGGVGVVTAYNAIQSGREALTPPPAIEQQRTTESSTVFTIEGWDKAGRHGLFDVVVARKEILWVTGSAEEIEKGGQTFKGSEISKAIFDQEVMAALANAQEIVAVGTASQEGDAVSERVRAARRAAETARLAATVIDPPTPIWALNLGQYREPCAACETSGTSWQRPFIVIAVKTLDDGANLEQALSDALTGKSQLPSPSSYSSFEMTKVR